MSEHTVFKPDTKSPCPWHGGHCAYTGEEQDRCPYCHVRTETILEREGDVKSHLKRESRRNRMEKP